MESFGLRRGELRGRNFLGIAVIGTVFICVIILDLLALLLRNEWRKRIDHRLLSLLDSSLQDHDRFFLFVMQFVRDEKFLSRVVGAEWRSSNNSGANAASSWAHAQTVIEGVVSMRRIHHRRGHWLIIGVLILILILVKLLMVLVHEVAVVDASVAEEVLSR